VKGEIKPGDWVVLSATFLRSIDPSAAKGWPTTMDRGKGLVVSTIPIGEYALAEVVFIEPPRQLTFNTFNLIHAKSSSIYNEAMRAEHRARNV